MQIRACYEIVSHPRNTLAITFFVIWLGMQTKGEFPE